ncbi:hypothetical protein EPN16_07205 [bacterium]|nr:MAG: hypothetical protein EPN16_07205 [bacterium]
MFYSKIHMRLSALVSLILSVMLAAHPACLIAESDIGELLEDKSSVKITMDLQDVSLRDALKMLSVQSGTNFIASEAVADRKLTLYLDNVPLRDAMDKIFKVNNLTYELDVESNIFTVRDWGKPSLDLETRIYFLKYTRVTNSRLNEGISLGSSSSSSSGSASSASSAASSTGSMGSSEGSSASSATANGLKDTLATVLSEYGKLIEDPATNSIIVTDMLSKFPVIEQLIAKLDVPIPQVMIEVEILDVDKSEVDKLGFKYSDTSMLTYTGPNFGATFPLSTGSLLFNGLMGKAGNASWNMNGLSFAMNFLATRTSTKFLARPRLFMLNNETAQLKLSSDEVVGSSSVTVSSEGSSTTTVEAERAETGVILGVTPQISMATGEITMVLQPIVREAVKSAITLGTQEVRDVEERSVKSTVRVKDGETVIIGGLIRNKDILGKTRVPLLGEIPILGMLFRHKSTEGTRAREILVFITPKIIKGSAPSARGRLPADHKRLSERKQDEYIGPSVGLAAGPQRSEIMSQALKAYER